MNVDKNTPMRQIVIAGLTVTVPAPYTEGYQLKPNEAAAMNQVLAENVRNNNAKRISKAVEEAKVDSAEKLPAAAKAKLQAEINEYITGYEFGVRTARTSDPVEAEARSIAKERVAAAIKAKGYKIKDYDNERMNSLIDQTLEKYPDIRKQAESVVKARQNVGKGLLDDLDLGAPTPAPAAAAA